MVGQCFALKGSNLKNFVELVEALGADDLDLNGDEEVDQSFAAKLH